eukprot:m.82833 g.82833  ORF g.82833 m.82833 type:complete len:95 (-) comp11144_c0_seq1:147-431(-)
MPRQLLSARHNETHWLTVNLLTIVKVPLPQVEVRHWPRGSVSTQTDLMSNPLTSTTAKAATAAPNTRERRIVRGPLDSLSCVLTFEFADPRGCD